MKYVKHVFICTNQKDGGKKCCGEESGMELVNKMKNILKENNIAKEIRAQRAGCLDVCGHGPSMVIYPEGVFYGNVKVEDVQQIVEDHLINNKIVDRLKIDFD